MQELWDAYDSNFQKIENKTLVRGEKIPEGMYHLVCEIVVKGEDGTYLLMQRDKKKHFGGMWELTAGGSVLQGETALQGAMRELREETGIVSEKLTEIGRVVHDGHRSLYVLYLCQTGCEKDSILLQEGETMDYRWVSRNTLMEMGEDTLASQRAIKLVKELCL